jgi:hypothetical protein
LQEYKPIFINNIVNSLNYSKEFRSLNQEKKKYIINIANNFLTTFFRELEADCFKVVKNQMMTVQEKINPFIIGAVCSRFKRDLFIIDSSTKLPLKHTNINGKKSIVLLKFGDKFEPIARSISRDSYQYEFEPEDEYIKKLSMFLLNPEKFKTKYPQLFSEAKKKRNVYVSDSESDEDEQKLPSSKLNDDESQLKVINDAEKLLSQFSLQPERQVSRSERELERSRDREQEGGVSSNRLERSRDREQEASRLERSRDREQEASSRLERSRDREQEASSRLERSRDREQEASSSRLERSRDREQEVGVRSDKRELSYSSTFKKSLKPQPPTQPKTVNHFVYNSDSSDSD